MQQKLDALDKKLDALNSAEQAKKEEIKRLGAQLTSLKSDIAAESRAHKRTLAKYQRQSAEIAERRRAAILATQQASVLLAAPKRVVRGSVAGSLSGAERTRARRGLSMFGIGCAGRSEGAGVQSDPSRAGRSTRPGGGGDSAPRSTHQGMRRELQLPLVLLGG